MEPYQIQMYKSINILAKSVKLIIEKMVALFLSCKKYKNRMQTLNENICRY